MTIEETQPDFGDEVIPGEGADNAESKDTKPEDNDASDKGKDGDSDKLGADTETEEEKAEREEEERKAAEAADKDKRLRIPKHRFDEAVKKEREKAAVLQKQLDELRGGKEAARAKDETDKALKALRDEIEKNQDKYEDLILDGKKDEARVARMKVDELRDQLLEHQTSVNAQQARDAAVADMSFNAKLTHYESVYPELNSDHEDYDVAKEKEVLDLLTTFIRAGQNRADALTKAVKYVMGPPSESKGRDGTGAPSDKRAEEARRKAADAAKKQPPNTNAAGKNSDAAGKTTDKVDVMRLTQTQFAKLDEDALAKARGDVVE